MGTLRRDWAPAVTCPVCVSSDVDGLPMDKGMEMPNPDDEDRPLVGYAVVAFVCQACGHRWIDGESDPAGGQADDNPPITCPHCGSTDQEYIYAGEWICGDCGKHWNDRWSDDLDPATGHSDG